MCYGDQSRPPEPPGSERTASGEDLVCAFVAGWEAAARVGRTGNQPAGVADGIQNQAAQAGITFVEQLLQATGSHEENPTLSLPCREVLARGQKNIEVIGPVVELEAEMLVPHHGFWASR